MKEDQETMPSPRSANLSPTPTPKRPIITVEKGTLPPIPNLNNLTPTKRISLEQRPLKILLLPGNMSLDDKKMIQEEDMKMIQKEDMKMI